MSQYRAKMVVTPTQADYLQALLKDDIEDTELSPEEKVAATTLLSRVESVQAKYVDRKVSS